MVYFKIRFISKFPILLTYQMLILHFQCGSRAEASKPWRAKPDGWSQPLNVPLKLKDSHHLSWRWKTCEEMSKLIYSLSPLNQLTLCRRVSWRVTRGLTLKVWTAWWRARTSQMGSRMLSKGASLRVSSELRAWRSALKASFSSERYVICDPLSSTDIVSPQMCRLSQEDTSHPAGAASCWTLWPLQDPFHIG